MDIKRVHGRKRDGYGGFFFSPATSEAEQNGSAHHCGVDLCSHTTEEYQMVESSPHPGVRRMGAQFFSGSKGQGTNSTKLLTIVECMTDGIRTSAGRCSALRLEAVALCWEGTCMESSWHFLHLCAPNLTTCIPVNLHVRAQRFTFIVKRSQCRARCNCAASFMRAFSLVRGTQRQLHKTTWSAH